MYRHDKPGNVKMGKLALSRAQTAPVVSWSDPTPSRSADRERCMGRYYLQLHEVEHRIEGLGPRDGVPAREPSGEPSGRKEKARLERGVGWAGTHTRVKDANTWPSDTTTFASRRSVENIVSVLAPTAVCVVSPSKPSIPLAIATRASFISPVASDKSPRRICVVAWGWGWGPRGQV